MDENNANVDYNIRIESDTVLYDTMSSKIISFWFMLESYEECSNNFYCRLNAFSPF